MLRESAALARATGAYWQTHLSEDRGEMAAGGEAVPRGNRLPRRLRPGGRARTPRDHGARDPPVRARDRAPGRDRDRGRALPRIQPVPRVGGDAARPLPGGRDPRRPRVGRVGGSRAVDLRQHARGRLHAERPPRARRGSRVQSRSTPSTGSGWGPSKAPGRWASTARSARSRSGKEADMIAVDPRLVAPVEGVDSRRPGRDHVPARVPPAPRHGPRGLGSRTPAGRAAGAGMTGPRRARSR